MQSWLPFLHLTFMYKVWCFLFNAEHVVATGTMAWIFDLCRTDFRHLPRFAIVTAHVFLFPAHLQASSLVKYVTSAATLQGQAECLSDTSIRHFSSASSAQSDSTEENGYAIRFSLLESSQLYSTTCIVSVVFYYMHSVVCRVGLLCKLLPVTDLQSHLSRFKGHGMLAPFTAGWQSNDLHPLIIERSEVVTLSFGALFWFTSLEM